MIRDIIKKTLIVNLVLSSVLVPQGFCFDTLSPKTRIDHSALKQEMQKLLFLRQMIQRNLSYNIVGACRTYAINLAVSLFIYGIEARLGVDADHVWVETDEYILDAYMQFNAKTIRIMRSEPEIYAQWESSGGVIPKQSMLAERFYNGKTAVIDDAEFTQMIAAGGPYYKAFIPTSLEVKITTAYGLFVDEQSAARLSKGDNKNPLTAEADSMIVKVSNPVLSSLSSKLNSLTLSRESAESI